MRLGTSTRLRFRPRHVIAPVLIAGALALSACGGSSSKATNTAAPSSGTSAAAAETATTASGMATSEATGAATASATATTAPTPTKAATATKAATKAASGGGTMVPISPVPLMQQVVDAWKQVKSYKMTMTMYDTSTNTKTGTATIETMLPDKMHWVINENGQSIEMISISGTTYLNIGGTWTKTSTDVTSNLPGMNGSDLVNQVTEATPTANEQVSKTGTDTVNGVACDVYTIKSDSGTDTIWVGQKDHLLYKGQFQGDTTRTEILFSDYNQDFNIQAPM